MEGKLVAQTKNIRWVVLHNSFLVHMERAGTEYIVSQPWYRQFVSGIRDGGRKTTFRGSDDRMSLIQYQGREECLNCVLIVEGGWGWKDLCQSYERHLESVPLMQRDERLEFERGNNDTGPDGECKVEGQEMAKLQSQSTSNPTSISQVAAEAALNGDQNCIKPMLAAFKQRHMFVLDALNNIDGIKCR